MTEVAVATRQQPEIIMQGKRILVTGGCGFIGSHLVERLVNLGHDVTVLDDLSTGKIENIKDLFYEGNIKLAVGSISNLEFLRGACSDVDYVFHEAALARVPRSIDNPILVNKVNIEGTLNVLMAAKESKVKKVVYASSSSVYGDNCSLPQSEVGSTIPVSPYALTKLTGELYCDIVSRIYGLPTVSLRYFCVYGKRQDSKSRYATVIPAFMERVFQNLPPFIFGDGNQSRDFTYIEDVVDATILGLGEGIVGTYNIGSGEATTINQLAQMILDITGKSLQPIYKELRLGDVRHTLADVSKAKTFGYKPRWKLWDGLKELL